MVDIFKEIRYTGSDFGLPTPEDTVKAMLDLVPPDFWSNPNARVLEVNIKDMAFLKACYERFRAKLNLSPEYIWGNMLYGACISDALLLVFKNECPEAVNIGAWHDMKLSDMKFDLVVGNPPYNNMADVGFLSKAIALSRRYVSFVMPTKWCSRPEAFNLRSMLAGHIRELHYFPETVDVFQILMPCGVAYFLYDSEYVGETIVENKCTIVSAFNSKVTRSLIPDWLFNNFAVDIVRRVLHERRFVFDADSSKRYQVWVTNMPGYGGGGSQSKNFYSMAGNVQVLCRCAVLDAVNETYSARQSRLCFSADTEFECSCFVSWLYSKFIRFLVLVGIDRTAVLHETTFRFVPDPGPFDHIFTDEELYIKYNLSDDQIKVIESVIKSR